MSVSFRNRFLVWGVCVAVIATATCVKISQSLQNGSWQYHDAYLAAVTTPSDNKIAPDADFYESTTRTDATAAESIISSGPSVSAVAYLVGNISTGKVYLERKGATRLPVASMSKLITAVAATDMLTATTTVTITEQETAVASDTSRLYAGETFTVRELLYPMLLNSSNVAAEALASSTDRQNFLTMMSSYAWEVGMPSTFFADPSGLNPLNASSARDFFALAQYLYKNRPDILAITRTASSTLATTTDHGSHIFSSIHPFVNAPNFIGGKTGRTPEARDTMLTIMNIDNSPIAIVVLSSTNRKKDTDLLLGQIKEILVK